MRYRPWWLIPVLVPCLFMFALVSPVHADLASFRAPYITSDDCATLPNQPGFPTCVQTISGELVAFVFGEGGTYVRPGEEGGSPAVPTLSQVCDDQASCTNAAADTIFSRSAAASDPDLRCDIGIVGSVPGIRCFDASNVELTFDNFVRAGQTEDTTIDNGAGTPVSCRSMDDAGITDHSANESCGAYTNVRYISPRTHDSPPTCTSAGHNFIYHDDSENKWKVCQEGTLSDLLGTFDPTSLGATTTWGDGSQASMTWTWNVSGTDTSIAFGSAIGTFTGNWDATGRVQGSKLRLNTTTCLDLSGDRFFHDTDCDTTKDAGEEFLDYKNTMLTQYCWAGEDTATATLFLRSDCSEAISAASSTDGDDQATRWGPSPAGVYRNLRCKMSANVAASTTYTFTLRIDGVDESLTCSIATGASTCEDTTNTETVAAATRSTVKFADSTANDTTNRARCSVELHTE